MIQILSTGVVGLVILLAVRGIFKPGILLALMWATYAIEQVVQQGVPFFLTRPWFINVMLTAATTAAVGHAFLSGKFKRLQFTSAHLCAFALLLLCAFSYIWSISPDNTLFFLRRAVPYMAAFVLVAPLCAYDQEQIDVAIRVTIYFGGLVLLALAMGSFGGRAVVLERVGGELIEANPLAAATFGGYVTICAVFSLYRLRARNSFIFPLQLAIAFLGVYTIVRSASRGQLIFLMIACFIWLPITAKVAAKRSSIVAMIIAVVLAYGGMWLVEELNFTARWQQRQVAEATEGRFTQSIVLLEKMFDAGPAAWLLGLGSSASYRVVGGYPHIVPAEVLGEEGLVGFGLFTGFLISVTLVGYRFMRRDDNIPSSRTSIGLLLALFTFEVGLGLKQGSLLGSQGFLCFGLCIVVGTSLLTMRRKPQQPMLQVRADNFTSGVSQNY